MKIGKSVEKALDEMELGDSESAMLHACNAIDGTARKAYPSLGNKARFTKLLRDNAVILGPTGMPGVNIVTTRFPAPMITNPSTSDGKPDLADVIYGVHRCTHGHGDDLPAGFELIPDAAGPSERTTIHIENGKVRLSDRIVFALLSIVIVSPWNSNERTADGYFLTFGGDQRFIINEWWGRKADYFHAISATVLPSVHFDFGDWLHP